MIANNKKILSNSLWMIIEKFFSIFGLIFVNAYMAKYIGAENFGKIAYTTTMFIFVQSLAWFGTQNLLFKRFSKNVDSGIKLSVSTQSVRQILFVSISSLVLLYLWFYTDITTFWFGIANAIASYFIISDIFTIHNNSQLMSYINAYANILGLIISLITRYILVYVQADVIMMAIPIVVFAIIPFCVKKYIFVKKNNKIDMKISDRNKYIKYLFINGSSLVIASLSIVLYTQISNIFLAKIVSFSALGVYNVAMTLGGAWSFVGVALITSYFSRIYAEKTYHKMIKLFRQINFIIVILIFGALIGNWLLGEWFIQKMYGVEFLHAVQLLPLIILATGCSLLGTCCYHLIVRESGYKYLSVKMFIMALSSLPITYWLISNYGVMGASYSYLCLELVSLTVANLFFKHGYILKVYLGVKNA